MCFNATLYFAPYALCVILPINICGNGERGGFFQTTLANIKADKQHFLWSHVVGMWLSQGLLLILTFKLNIEMKALRKAYLKQRALDRTVFVTGIPQHLRNTTTLAQYFNHVYKNNTSKTSAVYEIQFCRYIEGLENLVERREKTLLEESQYIGRLKT